MLTPLLIAAVVGYLLGSLPFGYLVARAKGVDIFAVGSRSPGATNVRRTLGRGPGNLVFVLDALKGAVAAGGPWAAIAWEARRQLAERGGLALPDPVPACIAGLLGALLGHSFSCFTGFRGGKGVATSVGGLLVLMPVVVVIGAAVWAAVFYASRYVSLASIVAGLALPLAAWLLRSPPLLLGLAGVIAGFVLVRHRSNLVRLLRGTEHKFVKRPDHDPTP